MLSYVAQPGASLCKQEHRKLNDTTNLLIMVYPSETLNETDHRVDLHRLHLSLYPLVSPNPFSLSLALFLPFCFAYIPSVLASDSTRYKV